MTAATLELFEQRGLTEKLVPSGNPGVTSLCQSGPQRIHEKS